MFQLAPKRFALIVVTVLCLGAATAVVAQAALRHSEAAAWSNLKLPYTDAVDSWDDSTPISTSNLDVTGMTKTVKTKGGPLIVTYSGSVITFGGNAIYQAFVDGVPIGPAPYKVAVGAASGEVFAPVFSAVSTALARGVHTVEIKWLGLSGYQTRLAGPQFMSIQHN